MKHVLTPGRAEINSSVLRGGRVCPDIAGSVAERAGDHGVVSAGQSGRGVLGMVVMLSGLIISGRHAGDHGPSSATISGRCPHHLVESVLRVQPCTRTIASMSLPQKHAACEGVACDVGPVWGRFASAGCVKLLCLYRRDPVLDCL
jgi:hypothetical protein